MSVFPIHIDAQKQENALTPVEDAHRNSGVDLSVLRSFDDAQTEGESDLIVELIDLYQEEASRSLERIRQSVKCREWLTVKQVAHSLRGSSSNLGIMRMAQIVEELEHQELNDVLAASLVRDLDKEFMSVVDTLLRERERRTR